MNIDLRLSGRVEFVKRLFAHLPEEVMNSVRRIEGIRKVFQISFMVYWRHYG